MNIRSILRMAYYNLLEIRDIIIYNISPKRLINRKYLEYMGYPMNWDNPEDLNEKINWMKLYSDTSSWSTLADKFQVRNFVTERGLNHILVPLYQKYDSPEQIEWANLPPSYVMKMNNGSGDILICKEGDNVDFDYWKKRFKLLFKKKFGHIMGEPHYDRIKPCIVLEQLLDVSSQPIKTSTLIDYKVLCINGEPRYIWTCHNRNKSTVEVSLFDTDWNYHPEKQVFTRHYVKAQTIIPRPAILSELLDAAEILSKGFPEVRVDFYIVGDKLYFGEMTFSGQSGYMNFYTKDLLLELGRDISL